MGVMRTFAFLAALILCWSSLCAAEDVSRDTVAEKFGYKDWQHFLKQMPTFWDWKKVDSSKFSPAEIAFVLKWAVETYPPSPDTGRLAPMWFNLHLKFKDAKALELVEKEFARGWYWAAGAEDAVRQTGELSLIPVAAKYLWVDNPSEPMPPMDDVKYPGEPSVYAALAILGLLKRPGGSNLKEIMQATNWQAHSVRGFISGTLGKKMSLPVVSTKSPDGERTYSIQA